MIEVLRALRLGAINLFGIAVPGFLLIFFTLVGFLLPVMTIALHVSNTNWEFLISLYEDNAFIVIATGVLFSYVAGYILRLSTPDDLDEISATKVVKALSEKEKSV